MAHRKLERFREVSNFHNCIVLLWAVAKDNAFSLKGRWKPDHFKRDLPLCLELGCGKGEYTTGLARNYPERNFIGVDIKGNRLWKGAKTAMEENMMNVAFLRTRIDFIDKAFGPDEVNEIWITFPDPQREKPRKRLTHPMFLERYSKFLSPGAILHLKTDSELLHDYTLSVIEKEGLVLLDSVHDLYAEPKGREEAAGIQTFYEQIYLKEGKKIKYLKFSLTSL